MKEDFITVEIDISKCSFITIMELYLYSKRRNFEKEIIDLCKKRKLKNGE